MKIFQTLTFVLFICLSGNLNAQDIHFTLFNMSPLTMNPALTGSYEGTFRVGGIYRDQYRSVTSSRFFSTPSFFADAPILMIKKKHWLGAGVMAFQDKAGLGDLETNTFQISAAIHLVLDKKSQNVLTVGFQGGQVNRKLQGDFTYEEDLNGTLAPGQRSLDFDQFRDANTDYFDLNAGVLLKSQINKQTNFRLGVSLRHLTSPNYNFDRSNSNVDGSDIKKRIIAHGDLNYQVNEKWSISPTFYFSNLSPANQFQLQGWAGYLLRPEEQIKLNFGLGYRVGDAAELLLGMDYKDLKVALSYDITLSSLNNATNYRGGFELAAYYTFKIYKKPEVKPVILCPHL